MILILIRHFGKCRFGEKPISSPVALGRSDKNATFRKI